MNLMLLLFYSQVLLTVSGIVMSTFVVLRNTHSFPFQIIFIDVEFVFVIIFNVLGLILFVIVSFVFISKVLFILTILQVGIITVYVILEIKKMILVKKQYVKDVII